jgi:pimeloyl-ACP methyl ester carboxylesterase
MSTSTTVLTTPTTGPVELTFDDQGEGEPSLLLHGGAGPQSMAALARLLAGVDDHRVISPIHPGFGGTLRPEALNSVSALASLYVALLDDLELENVTVIGNSVGGWIAAELALRRSARISGLVLVDAVGIDVEGHRVADVSSLTLPEIQALSFHDPSSFRIDPTQLSDAQKAIAASNAAALAIYAGSPEMADPTLGERLGELTLPTLVLWGDSDGIVDSAYGQAYASAIPGARFELLAASGHLPQLETPDLVLQAITSWRESRGGVE